MSAGLQGLHQKSGLSEVGNELEHTKNSQYPQQPYYQQILRARNNKAQVSRQDGQEIDNAEEAGSVRQRPSDTQQAQKVFDSEQSGKNPFTDIQVSAVNGSNAADTV